MCMHRVSKLQESREYLLKYIRVGDCKHYGYTDGNVLQPSDLSSSTVLDAPNVSDSGDEVSDHDDRH